MNGQLFSIVVADDEQGLLEAMCALVDWEAAGFRLVGSAGNGLDVLQMVEQLQPDLLLTDIQMPFITGTELARQVKELQPLIQVAFLSGYDDFAYAQSAIDSQVIAYLLKPISMEELTQALQGIHQKMEDRFRAMAPAEEGNGSLPLALSCLLLDGLEQSHAEEERRQLLAGCGMELPEGSTCRVLVTAAEGEGMLPQSAAQIVDRCLQQHCMCGSFAAGRRIFSLLNGPERAEDLSGVLDELYYVLRHVLGRDCAIGVSMPFTELGRSSEACRQAAEAVRKADSPGIIHAGENRGGISALVEQALRIIRRHYMDEDLSLLSVSEELHVSPNYLSANMKKYAGDTFLNLLIQQRMEAAQTLLQTDGMKIGEIARRCGYTDQHYFSYCFKKYYGVSPARMRRSEEGRV